MSMKITPIILLISITGLYGFIFPLSEAEPLLESLADDSDDYVHLIVGAHAIDAFVQNSQFSSILSHAWHECLHCCISDVSSYEQALQVLQRFFAAVKDHEGETQMDKNFCCSLKQWIARVRLLAERQIQGCVMTGMTRGRRSKKQTFWKPFLAGAALIGCAAAGYMWWNKHKNSQRSGDFAIGYSQHMRNGLGAVQTGVAVQSSGRDDLHAAQVATIAARATARLAPFRALQQEGRQWMPRIAPELCTYLQEQKGLVVHQVTQSQMLIDTPDRDLNMFVHYALTHQNHAGVGAVLRVWQNQAVGALLGQEQLVLSDDAFRGTVQHCVEQGEQFRTLVALWCAQAGSGSIIASWKRMLRNQQRYVTLCGQSESVLLLRHPEYYSRCSRFLSHACHQEIAAYMQASPDDVASLVGSDFGRMIREVQLSDIERYHSVGGMARSLDEWVYILRDMPDLQERAISLMYDEIIDCICRRFSCDAAGARLSFVGALWEGKRTRHIVRAVYNRELNVGAISGSRLPAGTSHPHSSAHRVPENGDDSSDDDQSDSDVPGATM